MFSGATERGGDGRGEFGHTEEGDSLKRGSLAFPIGASIIARELRLPAVESGWFYILFIILNRVLYGIVRMFSETLCATLTHADHASLMWSSIPGAAI